VAGGCYEGCLDSGLWGWEEWWWEIGKSFRRLLCYLDFGSAASGYR
jgi:hypothetical protein